MAIAITAATTPAIAHPDFQQTLFFGDSLTDSGYYRPLLPSNVQAITGKFTTNPGWVWAEHVASYYDSNASPNGNGQTGNNYAAGNARVNASSVNALGEAPPLISQTSTYLSANGGKADPNALYAIWGGANDLLAAFATPDQAQAIIGSATAAEISLVNTLKSAGAHYIAVLSIPDLGLTPLAQTTGTAAQSTAAAIAYNTALFTGLQSAGLNIIPVDTFHLLQEIIASPATYGFTNTTDTACTLALPLCNPNTLVNANAPNNYAFADSIHPTTTAHHILGQYTISILEAPPLQQVLTHSAQGVGRGRAYQVGWHLDGTPQHDGLRWWGSMRGDSQRNDRNDLYKSVAPEGLFGLDWNKGQLVSGGFVGYGRMHADFSNDNGTFKQKDKTLGGFFGWYTGPVWVNAQISYSWLNYDVNREVQLGPATRVHRGSPNGSNLTAALNASYEMGEGQLRYGSVAGLIWQKTKLDGYTEQNTSASALGYADQRLNSLLGRVGGQIRFETGVVNPYLQVTYDHEFKKQQTEASAWLQTMPETGMYSVPGLNFNRNYVSIVLGARANIRNLQSNVGLTTTTQKNARDTTLFVNVNGSF
ncbi:autotransporter domain-containing protein [Xylella taiwanensis]|uniref:Autotransporter domain-containing protein n=1 Tax=Xylella taiwanensis TaxID=1444770 RepID=A0ABS8TVZ8_9GAMM|nr:autotransporter domain-containing protein [Xylella taiwanensis]MCD8455415.1 autotransporter domain-containing protein [Xylella taiwanensis]MCD8457819.1 autotransporter domain-containing protein [Xylella taiwanensis]MCD8459955.1 autotransporter domain-containing protein [Xylella taiwanensis]MCD8463984.1 autotransporter domain-containing protein [Xylella taiwanensis]MCD8464460.1 autotransporter domain-containing protein [Xylella taiwanensis]